MLREDKLIVVGLMEITAPYTTKVLLPNLHDSATGCCRTPDEYNPSPHTLFLIPSVLILYLFSLQVYGLKFCDFLVTFMFHSFVTFLFPSPSPPSPLFLFSFETTPPPSATDCPVGMFLFPIVQITTLLTKFPYVSPWVSVLEKLLVTHDKFRTFCGNLRSHKNVFDLDARGTRFELARGTVMTGFRGLSPSLSAIVRCKIRP